MRPILKNKNYEFERMAVTQELLENYLEFLIKFNNFKPEVKKIID